MFKTLYFNSLSWNIVLDQLQTLLKVQEFVTIVYTVLLW